MKKLHIKFTADTKFLQGYCNTEGQFYGGNGKNLPTIQAGAQELKEYADKIMALSQLMINIDATETFYQMQLQTKGEIAMSQVLWAVKLLISAAVGIEPEKLYGTTYSKNKESISFGHGTVTIQLTK